VIKTIAFWNVTPCRLVDISEEHNCKSYQCENFKYQSFVCVCICVCISMYVYILKRFNKSGN
jgi:hypothetical protein